MFGFFIKWEIADIRFSITKVVELLSHAYKTGGYELAVGSLKRLGRNPRKNTTMTLITLALPKHDFDIGIMKGTDGGCAVTFAGGERYAGFSFTCSLPPQAFIANLKPDPLHGISWRARRLYDAIQEDQDRGLGFSGA